MTSYTSSWVRVDQAMINLFAGVTGDHQFIHTDPGRAATETPFGGTIAHGFLSLSLLSAFAEEALPPPEREGGRLTFAMNYGFDKVRFLAPVRSGSRVRGVFSLAETKERGPGQVITVYDTTVEIEGEEKPALVAQWLGLGIFEEA